MKNKKTFIFHLRNFFASFETKNKTPAIRYMDAGVLCQLINTIVYKTVDKNKVILIATMDATQVASV